MIYISSAAEFDKLLRQSPRLIAHFTSNYCKPCSWINPKYDQLAARYKNVVFVVIDVDANRDLAKRYKVDGMPTFFMFKRAKKIDECFGLNEEILEAKVKKLAS
ncbi:hypothetical protein E4U60_005506 [Claviceps pazoutovae]|uniref:Thioredoxin domain-containing protein n=1 Tax=Claviceps pazoutovae TaxID=1649127 RepID=A0A9P7SIE4_9HYPO|nr:hypothetical protein E4U60_005506 [Claviceps pazoutovae]